MMQNFLFFFNILDERMNFTERIAAAVHISFYIYIYIRIAKREEALDYIYIIFILNAHIIFKRASRLH